MLFNWIKGLFKAKHFDDTYYYRLRNQRLKADLNYANAAGWSNLEFRTFK